MTSKQQKPTHKQKIYDKETVLRTINDHIKQSRDQTSDEFKSKYYQNFTAIDFIQSTDGLSVGQVEFDLKFPTYFRNGLYTTHGGTLTTTLDYMTIEALYGLDQRDNNQLKLDIEFLTAVPLEKELKAVVTIRKATKNMAFLEGMIIDKRNGQQLICIKASNIVEFIPNETQQERPKL
eukprot:403334712